MYIFMNLNAKKVKGVPDNQSLKQMSKWNRAFPLAFSANPQKSKTDSRYE